jgi:YHS domain-containing protein
VQRTFSLRSAVELSGGATETPSASDRKPSYTILLLYASALQRRPLGLLTLYERSGSTVISAVVTPQENGRPSSPGSEGPAADANADLMAALVRSGLDVCLEVAASEDCIALRAAAKESSHSGRLVQDPVCGRWLALGQAEAAIEHDGKVHYVCCPLCKEGFERDPRRYV